MSNTSPNSQSAAQQKSGSGWSNRWGKRNSAGVTIASSLDFQNISYSIRGKQILDDVTLGVKPGEVLCLLGPSGSGKTTLLRIAAGLVRAQSGRVVVDGRIIADERHFVPPDKRGVGLVFQDYALFPHLTIQQNVEYGLSDLGRKHAKSQALRVLSRVGLEDRAQQYPHVLSGGEQQRVALARALAPRPGILLMDEPFSGLDSRLRDAVRDQSLDLLRETRSTCIIVTHDAEEALRVGDRIALIRDGKLVQYGSAHDLYYRPNSLFTAGFFSEINVIPAQMDETIVRTVFGSMASDHVHSGSLRVAIRHTDVTVNSYQNQGKGTVGRIVARRFIGTSELLEIMVEDLDEPFNVRIRANELPNDTSLVLLNADLDRMMIFDDEG